ncbi:MAG: SdrD B-like domain-containing protein [Kiritimatiellia bacterium]
MSDDAGGSMVGGVFTAEVGPLAAGGSRTISVRVGVNAASPAASLVNTAAVNSLFLAVQTNAFIGDYVFLDVDGNDLQSPGDLPVTGATVNLYDSSGTVQLASTTTDGSRAYGFIVPRAPMWSALPLRPGPPSSPPTPAARPWTATRMR